MADAPYKNPEGFRFNFKGVSTADVPDALPPDKYAIAKNIRTTGTNSIRTRQGYNTYFSAGILPITDMRTYARTNTDSAPRMLVRNTAGEVYLDTGTNVGNMNSNNTYGHGRGASMVPFRPSQSQQSWMYVSDIADYRKFSAPASGNNAVLNYKAGIAEPQDQVEAVPAALQYNLFTGASNDWANGGTAGNITAITRSNNTTITSIADPAGGNRSYVGVTQGPSYTPGMTVSIASNFQVPIQQVFAPLAANNVSIAAIYYLTGSSGNCVIVPTRSPNEQGPYGELSALQRGSIIQLGGNENALVQGVVLGPNGTVAIQTSTSGTHTAGETIKGVTSLALDYFGAGGVSIVSTGLQSNIATGIGYLQRFFYAANENPFTQVLYANNNAIVQENDYVHCSIYVDDPTKITEIQIKFDVNGANNATFTGDLYYYAVRPNDIVNVPSGNTTQQAAIQTAAQASIYDQITQLQNDAAQLQSQEIYTTNPELYAAQLESINAQISGLLGQLDSISPPAQAAAGENQWTEVTFPISSMTRVGTDFSKSLAQCGGVQFQVKCTGNVSFRWGSLWVGGGGQPDVGNNGSPYFYRVVPLSSVTGARGNPSPTPRYGVTPRRQPVIVKTSSMNNSYDAQIDTWEIYRYGGSLTSYRYVGSVAAGSDFVDNVYDDSASRGDLMPTNNTEPWPSIDAPWKLTAGNSTITANGQYLTLSANANQFPETFSRWLPGTLVSIGGSQAYTLRSRPTGSSGTWVMQLEQAVGSGSQNSVYILEPNVAAQPCPYVWGPDEQGYFFAAGDPLRPGTVYFSKPYAPDAAPTAQTLELCAPSEPLMGGEIIRGVSLVASSKRWWSLYFQSGGEQIFKQLEVPIGAPLVSPYAKCTDGNRLWFWSRDGIYVTDGAGSASITDEDLYDLFPHAGLAGKNVTRSGVTYYAPDYTYLPDFRLCFRDGWILASYRDSTQTYRVLVYNVEDKAWSMDEYANQMTAFCSIDQPPSAEQGSSAAYVTLAAGDYNGGAWKFLDYVNDNGTPISCVVATSQRAGSSLRANEWWGDQYVDLFAASNVTVLPVSVNNNNIAAATVISANANRQFAPVSLGGGVLTNFLGLQLSWSDNFSINNNATTLYAWQPSFIDKPETTKDRYTDWDNFGDAYYVQGFRLHANTFGNNKTLVIRNADDNTTQAFAGGPANNTINHAGEQVKPYYFLTPFISHMVRIEPDANNAWQYFGVLEWIKEPTPEPGGVWMTQWTGFGLKGYKHIPRIEFAYSCNATATLSVQSYDGTSANNITLPSTSGVMQRKLLTLTANKGQLYRLTATSSGLLQIFLNDCIVWINVWGDSGPPIDYRQLGKEFGDKARI